MNSLPNKIIILFYLIHLIVINSVHAQTTKEGIELSSATLEQCYEWTRQNFPMIKQLDIIDKSTQFNLSNASKGYLPQITLNGQASYQSDVTTLPIDLPNLEIPTIDQDQYKIYGDIYQPLTHFGSINANVNLLENKGEIEKQQIEIDLYKLRDRVNQIYFGILLINKKIDQLETIITDLDSTLIRIDAGIENGTATIADRQLMNVEQYSIEQQIVESTANKMAFLQMLSTLTGKDFNKETNLEIPEIQSPLTSVKRPELALFELQTQSLELQKQQIKQSLIPAVGIFAQGGYGRPALNFLSNEFELYYIAGLRLSWNISPIYHYQNSMKLLDLSKESIRVQEKTFLLNTGLTQSQQSEEIAKYNRLIETDKVIIELRENLLRTAKVQMENGLITTIDYVKFLNDVNRGKQKLLLHETQRLLSIYNLKTTLGN